MSNFLLGVPGKLKTLLDRLTSTRAALMDNMDAAVSTRAAASTALSSAQWTNTLAAGLLQIALKGILVPPKASGLSAAALSLKYGTNLYTSPTPSYCTLFESAYVVAGTSYANALNYTGSGFLALVCAHGTAVNDASTGSVQIKITLDGVEVLPETSVAAKTLVCPIGSVQRELALDDFGTQILMLSATPMLIPFYSSCQIQAKYTTQAGGYVYYKLIKTS